MSEGKSTLMIVVGREDYDFFKKIQKEHKDKGISVSYVFHEFVEAYKKNNKDS